MIPWLRIILRSPSVLEEFYEPWAYILQLITIDVDVLCDRFRRYLENSRTAIQRRLSITGRPVDSLAAQHFRRFLKAIQSPLIARNILSIPTLVSIRVRVNLSCF